MCWDLKKKEKKKKNKKKRLDYYPIIYSFTVETNHQVFQVDY